jgi:hypothetical protein
MVSMHSLSQTGCAVSLLWSACIPSPRLAVQSLHCGQHAFPPPDWLCSSLSIMVSMYSLLGLELRVAKVKCRSTGQMMQPPLPLQIPVHIRQLPPLCTADRHHPTQHTGTIPHSTQAPSHKAHRYYPTKQTGTILQSRQALSYKAHRHYPYKADIVRREGGWRPTDR